ncbi:MAG: right-handed parallel beta-helix repeat-containing protein [Candidatus Atribacteria bacterium]|nr:right-handed parallel beta-helix repeat-containing protein [Candidatus Atribacteria bacterium]
MVAIGTYYENIDFMGKDIILRSSDPDNHSIVVRTIIDGGGKLDSVVKFIHGETKEAVLRGFTIHGGVYELGGGILIMGSSPTIEKNIVTGNVATIGGGIFAGSSSSPTISENTITGNSAGAGGGILVHGNSLATISGNTITENTAAAEEGGGILVAESSSAVISGNTITGNTAKGKGGGIFVTLDSSVYSGGAPWNRVNYPPTAPPGNNVFSGNTHQNGQASNGCHVYFE